MADGLVQQARHVRDTSQVYCLSGLHLAAVPGRTLGILYSTSQLFPTHPGAKFPTCVLGALHAWRSVFTGANALNRSRYGVYEKFGKLDSR